MGVASRKIQHDREIEKCAEQDPPGKAETHVQRIVFI